MVEKNSSSPNALDEQQLLELREILLGKNFALVTDKIKYQSRDMVKNVIAEALYDRQKQDNAIDNVLLPIVERSVQTSVSGQSDKLIGALYPLVGGLVRKSVKAFLHDFIEKTNQLLENSFTFKGLKWRIKAYQAGVSFAQYAASQTFVYRVEHILLIHYETGVLLKSVDHNQFGHSDVDLISSMLTAINDFVADSLVQRDENEEQLQTIRTDNFSLLIKPGPHAMIVLAVTGNPPHRLLEQMQLTLENIHQLYDDDLRNFSGDIAVFDEAGSQLRDCLLSEEKVAESKQNKKPWLAWLLLFFVFLGINYWLFSAWQSQQLTLQITKLNQVPGHVIQSLEVDLDKTIHLNVIRDPDSVNVMQWLNENGIDTDKLILTEHLFYSTAPELINIRLQSVFQQYSTLEYQWRNNRLEIAGQLSIEEKKPLITQLNTVARVPINSIDISQVQYRYSRAELSQHNNQQQKSLFFLSLAEFNLQQLDFDVGSSQISIAMAPEIADIAIKYQELTQFAEQLNYRLALVLVGTSDTKGNEYTNNKLSLARALNVKAHLIGLGLNAKTLYTSNIGTMTLANVSPNDNLATRKVLFNAVYVDVSNTQIKQ